MTRKVLSFTLAIVLILSMAVPCLAVEPRDSEYFDSYSVRLAPGTESGVMRLSFYVLAAKTGITKIGVFKYLLYKADGTYVKTLYGSTTNGLLKTSGMVINNTVDVTGISGQSYYAVVTLVVADANGSHSRTVVTNIAVCP